MRIILFGFLVLLLSSCGDDGTSVLGGNDNQTSACTNCRLFVTDAVYNGNLGGISGADQKCANDINNPKDGTVFKAVIVGSTRRACTSINCSTAGSSENLNWVMKANTNYTDLSGTALFSTGVAGVPIFPVFSSAQTLSANKIWTGLEVADSGGFFPAGEWLTGETCGDWQDQNAGGGRYGENMLTNTGNAYWGFAFMTDACTVTNALYCVEQ